MISRVLGLLSWALAWSDGKELDDFSLSLKAVCGEVWRREEGGMLEMCIVKEEESLL